MRIAQHIQSSTRGVLSATSVAIALLCAPHTVGAQTIAITGGTVYPVSGPRIENGTVLVRDGRIVAVGANVTIPADARRIDAAGKWVTPGLINGTTQLGVVEIGAVPSTRDGSARGEEGIAAAFRVSDGLNPRSVNIPPAREGGVTSAVVVPNGGLISGQAAFIDLVEGTPDELIVRPTLAMVAQVGSPQQAETNARGELVQRLRELFEDVRAYQRNRNAYESGNSRLLAASRADLEALIPVLEGDLPLLVAADRASDIRTALDLSDEYGFELIIAGGAEAWMVANELAAARVPVLTGAMNNIPSDFAALGTRQENAALLQRANVPVVLVGNGAGDPYTFNVRNVRFEAGNAVAYGLTWDQALRAVTLTPAEVFGVSDRVGTLEPGKIANVVVWSGDPFEFATEAEHVLVRGIEYPAPSRQIELMRRYRTLPPDYRGTPGQP